MSEDVSEDLVKYLDNSENNKQLDEIVQRFCAMIHSKKVNITVVCFNETLQTDFSKIIKALPPEITIGQKRKGIVRSRFQYLFSSTDFESLFLRGQLAFKEWIISI